LVAPKKKKKKKKEVFLEATNDKKGSLFFIFSILLQRFYIKMVNWIFFYILFNGSIPYLEQELCS
jgi:hypothetical protein